MGDTADRRDGNRPSRPTIRKMEPSKSPFKFPVPSAAPASPPASASTISGVSDGKSPAGAHRSWRRRWLLPCPRFVGHSLLSNPNPMTSFYHSYVSALWRGCMHCVIVCLSPEALDHVTLLTASCPSSHLHSAGCAQAPSSVSVEACKEQRRTSKLQRRCRRSLLRQSRHDRTHSPLP